MKLFIKDSTGNMSLTATVVVFTMAVVLLKVLLNGAAVALGAHSYSFGTIDSLTIGALLAPTLGAYTARRWNASAPSSAPVIDDSAGAKPGDGNS